MKLTLIVLLSISLLPVFISVICIPFWTRKTESFGVTIPEEVYDHPNIKNLRKNYVLVSGSFAFIITLIFVYTSYIGDELTAGILFPLLIVMYIVGSMFIYIPFHQKMRDWKDNHPKWHADPNVITINTRFRQQGITYSNKWFILPFIFTLITIVMTLIAYPHIPNKIPIQYNLTGEVTKWVDKSYRSALLFPILQFYLVLIFLFVNTVIRKSKQQIDANNPDESLQRNIIFRRKWSRFIIVTGTGFIFLLSLSQLNLFLSISEQLLMGLIIAFTIFLLGWAIILSFTVGQGGSRLKGKNIKTGQTSKNVMNRDDDKYWKLGIFYFNKNDPAIFLEKRFGVGWTNNWAHPVSWLIIIGILLLAFGIPFFLMK